MLKFTKPSFARAVYAAFLAAAVLPMAGLSDCVFFGTKTVAGTTDTGTTDTFYATRPQTFGYCATNTTSGSPATNCGAATVNEIPSEVTSFMVNPIALQIQTAPTSTSDGVALLGDPTGQGGAIQVNISPDLSTLSANVGPNNQGAVWTDPACTSTVSYTLNASVTSDGAGTTATIDSIGATVPLSGSLTVDFNLQQAFTGDCAATMQALSACYNDVNQCQQGSASTNESQQEQVQALFEPYIQAGAMQASDIPHVANISYEATYQ